MSVDAFQLRAMLLFVCEGEARPAGTLGGVVSPDCGCTVIDTAAEVAVAPRLSVATAVSE